VNKSPAPTALANIEAFLKRTHGQITIGEIPPIRRAALAADGKQPRVALVSRENESIAELLQRLDTTLGKTTAENTVVDEVLPEIKRRRGG